MKTEQEKKSSVEKAATAVECPELRNAIRNFSGFSRRTQFFSGGGCLTGLSSAETYLIHWGSSAEAARIEPMTLQSHALWLSR